MDTAYKSRTWWMLRALAYMETPADEEEDYDCAVEYACERQGSTDRMAVRARYSRPRTAMRQIEIWEDEGRKCATNAVAPSGASCLTRTYVDRQGNTLPHLLAA